ncbi:MAG: hypothetical protein GX306_06895 [Clostridiales bacterium]|nr:hypothetical protein [Clostridiales bacterium]
MELKMNLNALNQLVKGSVIFTEGDPVYAIALVLKGRVLIHNNGAKIIANSGVFLGINDLYAGKYQSNFTAIDDLLIYVFSVNQIDQLEQLLSSNMDYHGFMVASNNRLIYDLNQIYQGLHKHISEIHEFLSDNYKEYLMTAQRLGYRVRTSQRIEEVYLPEHDLEILEDRINYYCECKALPLDVVKAFYSYGNLITLYQLEDQVGIINQQIELLKKLSKFYITMMQCLFDESESCLFQLIAGLTLEVSRSDGDNKELLDIMDKTIEELNKAEKFVGRMLGFSHIINRQRMEEIYHLLLTDAKGTKVSTETYLKYPKVEAEQALEEMANSFQKLLDYSGLDAEKTEYMKNTLLDYINLKDRNSSDTTARTIRRNLATNHYELYKLIFLKAYHDKDIPKIVDLFLKYGYADERLLSKEQLLSLYFLKDMPKTGPCQVYNIKEWLTLIYQGKKEPSKNEFDMEYPEYITSLKKQGRLSEKEAKEWLTNPECRLDYEIQNMFRYNNRTTSGQIFSFVPILQKDMLGNDFQRLYINSEKVNDTLQNLLKIDYSIFDHEVIYTNEKKNIVKEYVIKRVYPDIILMPTVGSNGIMWQEITGRKRDSSARFLLPIFVESNLTTLMVRMFGRYRWEMCRTVEGTAWNDIKHKSLTSEYSDYLQFYRKNKELSEEKKEKIKNQIQKGRNNSREIFVMDYEQWINFESKGAIKLNKPVREIMATYCPFSKEIRERIKMQPLFAEAMARYYREKQKKVRETESRIRLLQKEQIEIAQELIDTLEYYKEN